MLMSAQPLISYLELSLSVTNVLLVVTVRLALSSLSHALLVTITSMCV